MLTRHQRKGLNRYLKKQFPEISRLFKAGENSGRLRNLIGNILLQKRDLDSATSFELPLKNIRIQQLLDAGLNCADFRFWMKGELDINELSNFHKSYPRISIRTFTEEKYNEPSPRLPVDYDIGPWHLIRDICVRNNQNYHTLVNEALALQGSMYSGNLILLKNGRYVFSYLQGSGNTPRDADVAHNNLRIFMKSFDDELPKSAPEFVGDVIAQARNFLPSLRPITLEFSYYPYRVGILKRQEVFWEWRGGSDHDFYRIVEHLSPYANSLELNVDIPKESLVNDYPF